MREIKFRIFENGVMKNAGDRPFWISPFGIPVYNDEKLDAVTMQYTGLLDKNGKEIYEGDILYCNGSTGVPLLQPYGMPAMEPRNERFIVVKLDCGYVLRHISTFGSSGYETPNCIINGWRLLHNYDFWNHQRSFDVIGNIYENPELLKNY